MKKVILYGVLALLLQSCGFIRFDRPAGMVLKEIPAELRGTFKLVKPHKRFHVDSAFLNVYPSGYSLLADTVGELPVSIGDTVLITRLGTGHGLFVKERNGWEGYFIRTTKKGFVLTPLIAEVRGQDKETFLKKWFSGVTKVTIMEEGVHMEALLVKTDEMEVEAYIRKKLRKEGIEFKRIN